MMLNYTKRCNIPSNYLSSGKSARWKTSFPTHLKSLLTICRLFPTRFLWKPPTSWNATHCYEERDLFRDKFSAKQQWLSQVQEYFWCMQIGSILLDWLNFFSMNTQFRSFEDKRIPSFSVFVSIIVKFHCENGSGNLIWEKSIRKNNLRQGRITQVLMCLEVTWGLFSPVPCWRASGGCGNTVLPQHSLPGKPP